MNDDTPHLISPYGGRPESCRNNSDKRLLNLKQFQRQEKSFVKKTKWLKKSVSIREQDYSILTNRLAEDGFENLNQMVNAYLSGEFPKHQGVGSPQIRRLIERLRARDIVDPITKDISVDFYHRLTVDRFYEWLKPRYKKQRSATTLKNYYVRWIDIFWKDPELIKGLSEDVRAYVCDTMRRFAECWNQTYSDPEVKVLVNEWIERYEFNRGIAYKKRTRAVDKKFIEDKLRLLFDTYKGNMGISVRFAAFSGLRGTEIDYVREHDVCGNLGACTCNKIHVENKDNGLSIIHINRDFGNKHCWFTIVPTKLWGRFRVLSKEMTDYSTRKILHQSFMNLTNNQVSFMTLRKYHYNVNRQSEMREPGAEVLAGRANSTSAIHYSMHMIDMMTKATIDGWKSFGIDILKEANQ
ncbi:MAG: hypothetical protein ACJ72V_01620 [Nitrososphaeraceae archaeon]